MAVQEEIEQKSFNIMTVSYTHLDVYKRQLLDRMSLSVKNGWLDEQNRVFILFTIPCLLYTSQVHPGWRKHHPYDQGKTERLLGAWLLRVFHRGQRHRYDAGIPEDHVRAVQPLSLIHI